jgi:MurNAc alpha-1-phosphate uridylyltransferase
VRDLPDAVMIYAAGFGTRMGALTHDLPKPLIEVAGKPLIDHALDQVEGFGPRRIVVNLHYKADALRTHLAHRDILFSEEQPDILETGGGLKAALPLLGSDPVFTMNSDAVWHGPNPLSLLKTHWNPERMDALLLGIEPDMAIGHKGSGDFIVHPDGRAERGPGVVYSGVQIIRTDRLAEIEDSVFSLHALWDKFLNAGTLHAVNYPGKWCDVGHPEGIALAEGMLNSTHV